MLKRLSGGLVFRGAYYHEIFVFQKNGQGYTWLKVSI